MSVADADPETLKSQLQSRISDAQPHRMQPIIVDGNDVLLIRRSRRQRRRSNGSGGSDDADEEVLRHLANGSATSSLKKEWKEYVPTKSEVLQYIANTKTLCIRRAGTELQVTDSSGFPLLDVWLKRSCFRSTWILEAYGDTVLRMENTAKSWRTRKTDPSTLAVINSEEETLGFFVVGDPFLIHNTDKAPIARYTAYDTENGRSTMYQCTLESSGQEICRLQTYKAELLQLRFASTPMGFPLKLLALSSAVRLAAGPGSGRRRTNRCCVMF
ncbi:Protein T14B4.8 [Aphelenchoides avenae]|nr:Protein T14B4.8 [Aphelenchus avenae]